MFISNIHCIELWHYQWPWFTL